MKGKVHWYNQYSKRGIIHTSEGHEVMIGDANGNLTLNEADLVEFTLVEGWKGPEAVDITVIGREKELFEIFGIDR